MEFLVKESLVNSGYPKMGFSLLIDDSDTEFTIIFSEESQAIVSEIFS